MNWTEMNAHELTGYLITKMWEAVTPEEIPCNNPECEHGWDMEMNDVCEECYGAGHHD